MACGLTWPSPPEMARREIPVRVHGMVSHQRHFRAEPALRGLIAQRPAIKGSAVERRSSRREATVSCMHVVSSLARSQGAHRRGATPFG